MMKIYKTIKKLKKYIIRNFTDIILIEIPAAVFFIISILLIKYSFSINTSVKLQNVFSSVFLLFVPIIIFIILKCLKLIKNKFLTVIINILSFILIPISLFFYIYFSTAIYIADIFNTEFSCKTPPVSEYNTEVKKLSKYEYKIRHFPVEIPENAQNYFFKIENSFDGYDIHYLTFNIDDKYLDKVIAENKNRIYRALPYEKMLKYYKYIDSTLIEEIPFNGREPYTAYILKNENEDYRYTSGFIISKELHKIIYFYADFNLEDYENKENIQWRKNLNS